MIYLATPYSHDSPKIRQKRFEAVSRAAGQLMAKGKLVYSPISHSHPIAVQSDLPLNWEYWQKLDEAMIKVCSKLVVLKLWGWHYSTGVIAEIAMAEKQGLPIEYMEPETGELTEHDGLDLSYVVTDADMSAVAGSSILPMKVFGTDGNLTEVLIASAIGDPEAETEGLPSSVTVELHDDAGGITVATYKHSSCPD